MSISDYLEDKILDHVLRNTSYTPPAIVYMSLHTNDPLETGADEVVGGSYIRKAITMGPAASGIISNSAQLSFTSMPAVTITHAGIWDAESGVNFLWGGSLVAQKVVNAGDTVLCGIGDLDVTLD